VQSTTDFFAHEVCPQLLAIPVDKYYNIAMLTVNTPDGPVDIEAKGGVRDEKDGVLSVTIDQVGGSEITVTWSLFNIFV
jgi:hypothetical protein